MMKTSKVVLASLCLLLMACDFTPQVNEKEILSNFQYFKPIFSDIELLIPNQSKISEGSHSAIFNGESFQFAVREIGIKFPSSSLSEIVSNICSLSRINPNGNVTIQYEIDKGAQHWIRIETKCPRMEAAKDIMLARIGTGTYLLTLLDGTSDEMAEKIEKAFLLMRPVNRNATKSEEVHVP